MSRLGQLARPMIGRSPDEAHRVATPLELFFDLVFVVAVAQVSSELHHGLFAGEIGRTVFQYVFVFGAIWWAWINFTWFASAYDTDDVAYRLIVFVQLAGALVLAAGVPAAFADSDWRVVLAGYVIMRLALVFQWLRVARDDPPRRPAALRFAAGISVLQVAWIVVILAAPSWFVFGFMTLFALELLVPVWAQRTARTPWHPEHISERYGLFTIIVLGESILSASLAVASLTVAGLTVELVGILFGGLVTVFVMWWLYFERPVQQRTTLRQGFVWGYGHLPIWAAAAAVGAGLAVAIEQATGHGTLDAVAAGYAVTIPVAIYLAGLWFIHEMAQVPGWADAIPPGVTILALLLVPLTGWGVLLGGAVVAALLAWKLVTGRLATSGRRAMMDA
ncbi:MAG TPA: low temperature requirement protein A [Candidatus Limnocylindria bacterium]|nr:low temperature requirement protein A [Candidatus Limnocylindria bacterium]